MTLEKVVQIIAETRDMDPAEITRETTFDAMELDSLDVVEVIMAIEDAFGITIDGADELRTVGAFSFSACGASWGGGVGCCIYRTVGSLGCWTLRRGAGCISTYQMAVATTTMASDDSRKSFDSAKE